MKTLSAIIWLLGCSGLLCATSQIPERMDYTGKPYDMYSTPLSAAFPAPMKRPPQFMERPSPTDCHRGYIGSWRIAGDKLYLVSVVRGYDRENAINLGELKPEWSSPVFARWFSGSVRLGRGDLIMGEMGFSEVRSEEVIIEIEKGMVVTTKVKSNGRK